MSLFLEVLKQLFLPQIVLLHMGCRMEPSQHVRNPRIENGLNLYVFVAILCIVFFMSVQGAKLTLDC